MTVPEPVADVLEGRLPWHLSCADAAAFSASLPDDSIDLLLTDPPYFKVKGEAWDRQWDKPDQFLAWLGSLLDDWRRILKPNGSLYVFASPQMAARVECEIGKRFAVLNHVVFEKTETPYAEKYGPENFRHFTPASERIIFAEHYGADNAAKGEAGYGAKCDELRGFVFEPLRAYLDEERQRAGVSPRECDAALDNFMSGHYFTQSQWALPTRVNYEKLRELFNARGGEYLRKDYEDLRKDYEDLRKDYEDLRKDYEDLRKDYEDLRRPFNVTADVPYTDVWNFPTVQAYPGKHPCEKPEPLISHIVKASSKPDAVVADFFTGSGVVGAVSVALGRRFLGCEIDPEWAERGRARIAVGRQLMVPPAAVVDPRQVPLFGGET